MSYPLQYFRIAIGNTDNNVVVTGSSLAPSHHTGKANEKWYLNYKSANVFQITNALNNQVEMEAMYLLKTILIQLTNIGI